MMPENGLFTAGTTPFPDAEPVGTDAVLSSPVAPSWAEENGAPRLCERVRGLHSRNLPGAPGQRPALERGRAVHRESGTVARGPDVGTNPSGS